MHKGTRKKAFVLSGGLEFPMQDGKRNAGISLLADNYDKIDGF